MLRKGIVALMIAVMSVSSVQAADGGRPTTLMDFIRGPGIGRPNHHQPNRTARPGGVQHAVVEDVAKQVPEIRQTSSEPQQAELQPAESAPQPLPMQYTEPMSVPKEFSAVPQMVPQSAFHGGSWQNNQGPAPTYVDASPPFNFVSSSAVGANTAMVYPGGGMPYGGMNGGGNGGSGLYPSPLPNIPQNVGGTAIVHEALHPHEMLYPHRYKAMYGPYYYKVHGGWVVTPFGVWSKENWQLKGTTVDVKYKSHISPFALFHPPVIR